MDFPFPCVCVKMLNANVCCEYVYYAGEKKVKVRGNTRLNKPAKALM